MTKRLDYNKIASNGVKALGGVYGYVMQSGLPAELVGPCLSAGLADQLRHASTCTPATSSRRA